MAIFLKKYIADNFCALNTREFGVEPLKFIGEGLVVDTELVEHGSVEVVYCNDFIDRGIAELVGAAVGDAGADTGTGEPEGEGFIMMVATGRAFI